MVTSYLRSAPKPTDISGKFSIVVGHSCKSSLYKSVLFNIMTPPCRYFAVDSVRAKTQAKQ